MDEVHVDCTLYNMSYHENGNLNLARMPHLARKSNKLGE